MSAKLAAKISGERTGASSGKTGAFRRVNDTSSDCSTLTQAENSNQNLVRLYNNHNQANPRMTGTS